MASSKVAAVALAGAVAVTGQLLGAQPTLVNAQPTLTNALPTRIATPTMTTTGLTTNTLPMYRGVIPTTTTAANAFAAPQSVYGTGLTSTVPNTRFRNSWDQFNPYQNNPRFRDFNTKAGYTEGPLYTEEEMRTRNAPPLLDPSIRAKSAYIRHMKMVGQVLKNRYAALLGEEPTGPNGVYAPTWIADPVPVPTGFVPRSLTPTFFGGVGFGGRRLMQADEAVEGNTCIVDDDGTDEGGYYGTGYVLDDLISAFAQCYSVDYKAATYEDYPRRSPEDMAFGPAMPDDAPRRAASANRVQPAQQAQDGQEPWLRPTGRRLTGRAAEDPDADYDYDDWEGPVWRSPADRVITQRCLAEAADAWDLIFDEFISEELQRMDEFLARPPVMLPATEPEEAPAAGRRLTANVAGVVGTTVRGPPVRPAIASQVGAPRMVQGANGVTDFQLTNANIMNDMSPREFFLHQQRAKAAARLADDLVREAIASTRPGGKRFVPDWNVLLATPLAHIEYGFPKGFALKDVERPFNILSQTLLMCQFQPWLENVRNNEIWKRPTGVNGPGQKVTTDTCAREAIKTWREGVWYEFVVERLPKQMNAWLHPNDEGRKSVYEAQGASTSGRFPGPGQDFCVLGSSAAEPNPGVFNVFELQNSAFCWDGEKVHTREVRTGDGDMIPNGPVGLYGDETAFIIMNTMLCGNGVQDDGEMCDFGDFTTGQECFTSSRCNCQTANRQCNQDNGLACAWLQAQDC